MIDLISTEALVTFLQVVMIDLVLAGDNAIVIGLAAAGLPQQQRTRAIMVGILAATALRILFAGITTQLLQVIGLLLAGGIPLLWVWWKMWRELRTSPPKPQEAAEALVSYDINADGTIAGRVRRTGNLAGCILSCRASCQELPHRLRLKAYHAHPLCAAGAAPPVASRRGSFLPDSAAGKGGARHGTHHFLKPGFD
jgi:hypothetical protein